MATKKTYRVVLTERDPPPHREGVSFAADVSRSSKRAAARGWGDRFTVTDVWQISPDGFPERVKRAAESRRAVLFDPDEHRARVSAWLRATGQA